MAKTKVQISAEKITSWQEADAALAEIAGITSGIKQAEAAYNQQEQIVRAALTETHVPKRMRVERLELGLATFCEKAREDFGNKKSKELQHGIVSFRTTPPKVEKSKRFTWEGVLNSLKESPFASLFVRTKDEVNKESILQETGKYESSNGAEGVNAMDLISYGVEITTAEQFYYDVKLAVTEAK